MLSLATDTLGRGGVATTVVAVGVSEGLLLLFP